MIAPLLAVFCGPYIHHFLFEQRFQMRSDFGRILLYTKEKRKDYIMEILIIAVLAVAVFFALRRMIRMRKSGGCGCGCADCDKACTAARRK